MKNYMKIAVWLGVVLIALAIWLSTPNTLWRYVFYLRVPISMGLLLVGLPLLAVSWLRAVLRNLFVLRGRWQMAFVITSAIVAGTAVMLVANIILQNAPARYGVPAWDVLPQFWQSEFWRYSLAIALALPVCITATILSKERLDISASPHDRRLKPRMRWTGVAVGAVLGMSLLAAVSLMQRWLDINNELNRFLLQLIALISKQDPQGYIEAGKLAPGHSTALAFLVVWLLLYGFIGWKFRPQSRSGRREAPALLYVMFPYAVFCLLFGGLTFFFDFYRVLPLLLFLGGSAASYALFNVNHFYRMQRLQNRKSNPQQLGNFAAALKNRLQHQAEKTLVLVCASGGGIQAAAWTVEVLTGLQKLLGPSFTQAAGLISSSSGGSVGTMYFLDRFNLNSHCPNDADLELVFNSATCDSLDAVGWGLTYPDLARLTGFPFLAPKLCDRGTAVETDWQGELKNQAATLETWRSQALAGEIPIPVFNATLVEDGRRFLISPMTFVQPEPDEPLQRALIQHKFVDFNTLYGDYDISIATAARLSANFPYVSPICRNSVNLEGRNYHVADGGYFDNSGVFTVVEWLDGLLDAGQIPEIKRIILLQINAFPKSLPNPNPTEAVGWLTALIRRIQTILGIRKRDDTSKGGWSIALLGPLLTVFRVRDSTQTARNKEEIELLCQRWSQHGITIKHFPIFFPSFEEMQQIEKLFDQRMQRRYFFNQQGKYDPPLSWKLTNAEKKAIKHAWQLIASDPNGKVRALCDLWQEWS